MQCVANCSSSNPAKHKTFEQPVIQTLQMFVGEAGCWLVVLVSYLFHRSFKTTGTSPSQDIAYEPLINADQRDEEDAIQPHEQSEANGIYDATNIVAKPLAAPAVETKERLPLEGWKVMLLAIPACCDIAGTTLMNVGLLFVAASIYQMTRGALVLFVGLFSVVFLKRHLGGWKWASLCIVVAGVAVVGLAGVFESKETKPTLPGSDNTRSDLMAGLFVPQPDLYQKQSTKSLQQPRNIRQATRSLVCYLLLELRSSPLRNLSSKRASWKSTHSSPSRSLDGRACLVFSSHSSRWAYCTLQ